MTTAEPRRPIDVSVMRGGTSRGPVLMSEALPTEPAARDRAVLDLVGGDASQTDGLGGGAPQTSKLVLVTPKPDASDGVHFDYVVGNVVVGQNAVDWKGTCGNMTATVPLFAVHHGLATGTDGLRLRNLATGGLIDTRIKEPPAAEGGVAVVETSYLDPTGSVLGSALPTGTALEQLSSDGRTFSASVVDVTHPYLFLLHDEIVGDGGAATDPSALALVESLRGEIARRLGLAPSASDAHATSPAVPRVVLLHAGGRDDGDDVRITAVSMNKAIGSVPVTAGMCIAAARHIPETLVARIVPPRSGETATAVIAPAARLSSSVVLGSEGAVLSASVDREARLIMRGTAWV